MGPGVTKIIGHASQRNLATMSDTDREYDLPNLFLFWLSSECVHQPSDKFRVSKVVTHVSPFDELSLKLYDLTCAAPCCLRPIEYRSS